TPLWIPLPTARTPWMPTTLLLVAHRWPRAARSNLPTAPPSARSASRRRSTFRASDTNCAIRSPKSRTGRTPLAKADQLGSSRFIAVDADGKRTIVQKVDGQWQRDGQRGPQRAAAPERPVDATPIRDDMPQATNVVPMPTAPAPTEAADAKAI